MRLTPVYELDPDGVCTCDAREDCRSKDRGKHPRIPRWTHTASSDWERVHAWHLQWPSSNWAWVLDDHFVVDSDPRNEGFPPTSFFEDWEELVGFELTRTWTQATGGGGLHAVYKQPGLGQVRSGKLWLNGRALRGLEVKGAGGYVLVEPSNHSSGGTYRWLNFDEPADPQVALLTLRSRRGSSERSSAEIEPSTNGRDPSWTGERFDWEEALTSGAVPPGDQQSTLYRAACSLRARSFTDDRALEQLRLVVRAFRDGDASDPWTDRHAVEMWERVKDEQPQGTGSGGIVREFRPQLTLVRGGVDEHGSNGDAPVLGIPIGDDPAALEPGDEPPDADDEPLGRNTDRANAEELVRLFGDRIMFTPARGWWVWDGVRWRQDTLRHTWAYCAAVAESLRLRATPGEEGAPQRARANRLDQASGVRSTLEYAGTLVGVQDEDLDTHPRLLNCLNGVLDLGTLELQPHDPGLRLTRVTGVAYEPDAESALLDEYHATFVPDADHQRGLYKLLGSCVAGGNDRRLLVMLVGGTTSGKSQLASGLERALGDYVGVGNASIFRGNLDDRPRPDIITLLASRIALLEEAGSSWELHGDRIKHMTGGGSVSVRPMRSDVFIVMQPQFTPVVIANEVPRVKGADEATRRRLHVVPFQRTPEVEDPRKKVAFVRDEATLQALLTRVVRGYRDQEETGLDDLPHEFGLATAQAFDELDDVPEFMATAADEGVVRVDHQAPLRTCVALGDLHKRYVTWVREHGDATQRRDQLNTRAFGRRLRSMGWVTTRANGTRVAGLVLTETVPYSPY